MRTRSLAACLIGMACFVAAGAARGDVVAFAPSLSAAGWRPITFRDFQPTEFTVEPPGVLAVRARRSSSMIYREVAPLAAGKPILAWRWKVERDVAPTDLGRKGGEDRAIALFVAFAELPAERGLLQRFGQGLGLPPRELMDRARTLTFVWGGRHPAGTILASPYNPERGRIVVLRPAGSPTGAWVAERIDLDAVYRRAFGAAPAAPVAFLAVSGDSDDTKGDSLAYLADLRFEPR